MPIIYDILFRVIIVHSRPRIRIGLHEGQASMARKHQSQTFPNLSSIAEHNTQVLINIRFFLTHKIAQVIEDEARAVKNQVSDAHQTVTLMFSR